MKTRIYAAPAVIGLKLLLLFEFICKSLVPDLAGLIKFGDPMWSRPTWAQLKFVDNDTALQ